ncbi:MAG TPA: glycine zipper 2TM domain-containing protein [Crenotrichaceae bacterium]|nr:glycine zipper 2TM domain-containing protein [Crenotrichaceae bacterium]
MNKRLIGLLTIILGSQLFVSCAAQNPRVYEGAMAGGGIGAVAGALLDRHNRWRGAMIGGALGSAFGGATTGIASRAREEAAYSNRQIAYQSNDGWERIQATPIDYNEQTQCHKVSEKRWQGGRLVDDTIHEVCEGDKTEYRY